MTVSEATRRNIIRTIRSEGISWSGRLSEVEFLSRIYDLDKISSYDDRFEDARGDIFQHRIANDDWAADWIFDDERFNFLHCPDEEFLRFLCETVHSDVRPDANETNNLLELFNEALREDGYQLVERRTRFGKTRYEATGILPRTVEAHDQVKDIAEQLNSQHLQSQIVRMRSSLENDPELAIGTAKEFVESMCKTILRTRNKSLTGKEDLPKLVRLTVDEIGPLGNQQTAPDSVKLIQKALGSLATLTQAISELRNLHGTGHERNATAASLGTKHAALVVNAATTLALFLYESHTQRPLASGAPPGVS